MQWTFIPRCIEQKLESIDILYTITRVEDEDVLYEVLSTLHVADIHSDVTNASSAQSYETNYYSEIVNNKKVSWIIALFLFL